MDDPQLLHWLALARAPGLGPASVNPSLLVCEDIRQLFSRPPENSPERLRAFLRAPDWAQAEKDLAWLKDSHCRLLPLTSPDYPALLKTISDPPSVLFVIGKIEALQQPQLAMVGSRNPTQGGVRTARAFARSLAGAGLCITSGLASGIDRASHQGALEAGYSVAVMGTSLDRIYPAGNHELARSISQQGALVSEFPPGTPPRRGNFPRRNRIISGLSVGTLVVEAAVQSGSLITARRALEQGREVFAIPGSIHNPLARGCHSLIKQGAKLVETATDILDELASLLGSFAEHTEPVPSIESPPALELDPEYRRLLDVMGHDPVSADLLIEQTGLAPGTLSSMLLLLEMTGHVSSVPGGRYVRQPYDD